MTKRVRLLFEGGRPSDAPNVVWLADDTDLDDLARRVPGAVGYLDLDSGDLEVRPGTLDEEAIADQLHGIVR